MDGRKPPIRGLGERNGKFIARIAVKDSDGTKRTRWVTLKGAATVPRPQEGLKELRVQRTRNKLPVLKRTPELADDVAEYVAYFEARQGRQAPGNDSDGARRADLSKTFAIPWTFLDHPTGL